MILTKELMVRKITSNKKGVSLVEVVAAMAIFLVLFVSVSSLIMSGIKSENITNNAIKEVSVSQSIRDILYNEDNEIFKNYLNNKSIRCEISNIYEFQNMLILNIKNDSIKNNKYISKNDKNNPIKYIVYITTTSKKEGLYNVVLSVIVLNKSQYYYYVNGIQTPNIGEINLNTKNINILNEEMVVRPIENKFKESENTN